MSTQPERLAVHRPQQPRLAVGHTLKQKCIMSESHTCKTFFAKSKVPTFQIGLVYNHFRAKFSVDATSVCVCVCLRGVCTDRLWLNLQ